MIDAGSRESLLELERRRRESNTSHHAMETHREGQRSVSSWSRDLLMILFQLRQGSGSVDLPSLIYKQQFLRQEND